MPQARAFDGLTVVQLKEECRSRDLKVSGLKSELLERLRKHAKAAAARASAAARTSARTKAAASGAKPTIPVVIDSAKAEAPLQALPTASPLIPSHVQPHAAAEAALDAVTEAEVSEIPAKSIVNIQAEALTEVAKTSAEVEAPTVNRAEALALAKVEKLPKTLTEAPPQAHAEIQAGQADVSDVRNEKSEALAQEVEAARLHAALASRPTPSRIRLPQAAAPLHEPTADLLGATAALSAAPWTEAADRAAVTLPSESADYSEMLSEATAQNSEMPNKMCNSELPVEATRKVSAPLDALGTTADVALSAAPSHHAVSAALEASAPLDAVAAFWASARQQVSEDAAGVKLASAHAPTQAEGEAASPVARSRSPRNCENPLTRNCDEGSPLRRPIPSTRTSFARSRSPARVVHATKVDKSAWTPPSKFAGVYAKLQAKAEARARGETASSPARWEPRPSPLRMRLSFGAQSPAAAATPMRSPASTRSNRDAAVAAPSPHAALPPSASPVASRRTSAHSPAASPAASKLSMMKQLTEQMQLCLLRLRDDSLDDAKRVKYQALAHSIRKQMDKITDIGTASPAASPMLRRFEAVA